MDNFDKLLRDMITAAVDERINSVEALEERMVKMHGEYVTTKRASEIINVDPGTIRAMCRDGRLMATAADGHAPLILVRSMAGMVEDKTAEQPTVRATRRRKYDNYPNYYAK